jgi:hypothetical protein
VIREVSGGWMFVGSVVDVVGGTVLVWNLGCLIEGISLRERRFLCL